MGLVHDLQEAADRIRDQKEVSIISHIDADGIASETILELALQQEEIPVRPIFVRQIEPFAMRYVPRDSSFKIFTDLGAGQQNLLEEHGLRENEVLIVDHHVGRPASTSYPQVNALTYG
ncbi:MAG: phosphoesterase, partial [Methanomicrobiales archaeon]|nr:phosphoesterase [Methanomicrobiales archaeon]